MIGIGVRVFGVHFWLTEFPIVDTESSSRPKKVEDWVNILEVLPGVSVSASVWLV